MTTSYTNAKIKNIIYDPIILLATKYLILETHKYKYDDKSCDYDGKCCEYRIFDKNKCNELDFMMFWCDTNNHGNIKFADIFRKNMENIIDEILKGSQTFYFYLNTICISFDKLKCCKDLYIKQTYNNLCQKIPFTSLYNNGHCNCNIYGAIQFGNNIYQILITTITSPTTITPTTLTTTKIDHVNGIQLNNMNNTLYNPIFDKQYNDPNGEKCILCELKPVMFKSDHIKKIIYENPILKNMIFGRLNKVLLADTNGNNTKWIDIKSFCRANGLMIPICECECECECDCDDNDLDSINQCVIVYDENNIICGFGKINNHIEIFYECD